MKPTGLFGVLAGLAKSKPSVEDELVATPESPPKDESEAIGKAALEKPNVTVISANGSLKIYVREVEYNLRVMKPAQGVAVSELKRSLDRNREMVEQSFQKMKDIYLRFRISTNPLIIETEGAYRTATKNALVARANIDVLIPLINIRGGEAEYEGAGEGLPIEQHVAQLRRKAEVLVDLELGADDNEEEDDEEVHWQSVFIAGVIVVIVVMLLKAFL